MASEMRPLRAVMREVTALIAQKATGILLIVTDDNRFASIRLRDGTIQEVSFKNRYNDEAVQLLALASSLRARFQPGAAPASKHPPLGQSAMRWLLGGYENQQPAAQPSAKPKPHALEGGDQRAIRQHIVEQVALTYLGPIASLLCDEALSAHKDIDQALRQIASNLAGHDEADRFIAEAHAALAKGI